MTKGLGMSSEGCGKEKRELWNGGIVEKCKYM